MAPFLWLSTTNDANTGVDHIIKSLISISHTPIGVHLLKTAAAAFGFCTPICGQRHPRTPLEMTPYVVTLRDRRSTPLSHGSMGKDLHRADHPMCHSRKTRHK